MSQLECGTCKFAFMEKDRRDEVQIECRRHPPILFNSGSLAKFPKILPNWSCGEYNLGDLNYWELENSQELNLCLSTLDERTVRLDKFGMNHQPRKRDQTEFYSLGLIQKKQHLAAFDAQSS